MAKKYFMTIEAARKFARKKNKPDVRVMATSSVWQKKDKRRARKNYRVTY